MCPHVYKMSLVRWPFSSETQQRLQAAVQDVQISYKFFQFFSLGFFLLKLLLSPISPVVSLVSSVQQCNLNGSKPASGSPNFLHLCLHPGIYPVDNPSDMIGSRLDFMIFLCIFPVSKSWKDTYHGDLNEMPHPQSGAQSTALGKAWWRMYVKRGGRSLRFHNDSCILHVCFLLPVSCWRCEL